MTTTYTITDEHADQRTESVSRLDVCDTLRGWFDEAPLEVRKTAQDLGERLERDGRDDWSEAQGLAVYLGLQLERHDT